MGKEIVSQVQEAKIVPSRINPRRNTSRHIVIKLTKIKDRRKVLKATGKSDKYRTKDLPSIIADFLTETLQHRRKRHGIFKALKEKNAQPRMQYPAGPAR